MISSSRLAGINVFLLVLGAVGGALASFPITMLGKLLSGAPPATAANYLWNMWAFAIMGALGGVVLTWTSLRHVPLWRAIAEPALGAILGAMLAWLLGVPAMLILFLPLGIVAAATRLHVQHRNRNDALSAVAPSTHIGDGK